MRRPHIHFRRKGFYFHFEWYRLLIRFEWRAPLVLKPFQTPTYRSYFVFALEPASFMLQLYRTGAQLSSHTDRDRSTPTLALELWSPRRGRLECSGPHIRFLDMVIFDGADPHEVTECSGPRVSLLFQWASKVRRYQRFWYRWDKVNQED